MHHDYTIFGEFILELQEYLKKPSGGTFTGQELVTCVTGQLASDSSSKYKHRGTGRNSDSFHLSKRTVAKMLVAPYEGLPESMFPSNLPVKRSGRGGRGFALTSLPEDDITIETLWDALPKIVERYDSDGTFRAALENSPLTGVDPVSKAMFEAFQEEYGPSPLGRNDLADCVTTIPSNLHGYPRTLEVYKRLLIGILLGPLGLETFSSYGSTGFQTKKDLAAYRGLARILDGAYLIQLYDSKVKESHGNELGFEGTSEIQIGRTDNGDNDFVPTSPDDRPLEYVSEQHASLRVTDAPVQSRQWVITNLSVVNCTAVLHDPLGSPKVLENVGDSEVLRPGDEIYLAPYLGPRGAAPAYADGAVIRFYPTYKYVYR